MRRRLQGERELGSQNRRAQWLASGSVVFALLLADYGKSSIFAANRSCWLLGAAAMTIDYQLETADFLAFSEERRRFAPDSLSRLYYFGILLGLGVGLAVAVQSFTVGAVFTVLFIASGWFIQARIQRSYSRRVYSDENLLFNTRRWSATLTDEGIRISSDAADVLYRWSFIKRVFRGSRYVHFELTPIQQVHIPIRAFRDEEQIQKFISTAQSYVKRPAL
jgi:hypothetical protein